jgi:hypothetical protein
VAKKLGIDKALGKSFSSKLALWHPLKGPCQEKTLLHRKK